jgi:hypothetical protein
MNNGTEYYVLVLLCCLSVAEDGCVMLDGAVQICVHIVCCCMYVSCGCMGTTDRKTERNSFMLSVSTLAVETQFLAYFK